MTKSWTAALGFAVLLLAACGVPPATEVAPASAASAADAPAPVVRPKHETRRWQPDLHGRWHRPPLGSPERARIETILDGAAPAMLESVEKLAVGAAIWYDIDGCRYTGIYDIARSRNEPRLTVKMYFDCDGWNDSLNEPFRISVGMPLRLVLENGEWVQRN